jgi:hypothetical protein
MKDFAGKIIEETSNQLTNYGTPYSWVLFEKIIKKFLLLLNPKCFVYISAQFHPY